MRIGIGVPQTGTPVSGFSALIGSLIAEPWLTNRPDGHQTERILTEWKTDETGKKLRLSIRPDLVFHDGTPVTAEVAAEALRNSVANHEALSFTSIDNIRVVDARTIEVELKFPNAFLLPDLGLVTVRKPGARTIGAGPFRIVSQNGQQAVLQAYPQYYRGRPQIDEIDIATYPTQRAAWAALMRGEIDMLHEVSRDATDFVNKESTVRTYEFPRPYYIPLVFNVRRDPLRNPAVRQAINQALDKAILVRDGLNGHGTPADGPIWPGHWAYQLPPVPFRYNPDAARKLLIDAGYRSALSADSPGRVSFDCLVFADDSRFERLAVLVQKALSDVEIDMRLVPLPQDKLVARLKTGDFDAFLFEMFGRTLSFAYELWHSQADAMNNTGYTSADLTLDRMRSAKNESDMRADVADLERILHDDPPAAFIAWQRASRAVSTRFEVEPEPDRDILSNVWLWRLAGAPKPVSR